MKSILAPSNFKTCFAHISNRIRARRQAFKVPLDNQATRPEFVKILAKLTSSKPAPSQPPAAEPLVDKNILLADLVGLVETKNSAENKGRVFRSKIPPANPGPPLTPTKKLDLVKPTLGAKLTLASLTQPLTPKPTHKTNPYRQKHQVAPLNSIDHHVRNASLKHGVPENIIRGIIKVESSFNIKAVSKSGALGLMQLMPKTAEELGVTKPFDIAQNIDGGTRYLKKMLDRFDGDLKRALAAYNAGPTAVTKHKGEVPYEETRRYVKRVLEYSGHDKLDWHRIGS